MAQPDLCPAALFRKAYAFAPPSTVSVEPVIYFAFALARNATALAMSSGAP